MLKKRMVMQLSFLEGSACTGMLGAKKLGEGGVG